MLYLHRPFCYLRSWKAKNHDADLQEKLAALEDEKMALLQAYGKPTAGNSTPSPHTPGSPTFRSPKLEQPPEKNAETGDSDEEAGGTTITEILQREEVAQMWKNSRKELTDLFKQCGLNKAHFLLVQLYMHVSRGA